MKITLTGVWAVVATTGCVLMIADAFGPRHKRRQTAVETQRQHIYTAMGICLERTRRGDYDGPPETLEERKCRAHDDMQFETIRLNEEAQA